MKINFVERAVHFERLFLLFKIKSNSHSVFLIGLLGFNLS